jgi:hypothetical protein
MTRQFIIGLSIFISFTVSLYALIGIVSFKALGIPLNAIYQDDAKVVKSKDPSPVAEDIIRQSTKEPAAKRAIVKELQNTIVKLEDGFSNSKIETQDNSDEYIIQTKPNKNINNIDNHHNKINIDDQLASRLIYTIQTGSFLEITPANKQFNSMLRILNGKEFNYLRIEKVDKYYSVRLGWFTEYNVARQFHVTLKPKLSNAVILKAYIKKKRIIRIKAFQKEV